MHIFLENGTCNGFEMGKHSWHGYIQKKPQLNYIISCHACDYNIIF